MEEIEQRLKDATDSCLKTHAAWNGNRKDGKAREALMEAVHELRKVAARLEIEIAISERDEMASKPIPIPAHRSNKRKQHDNGDDNRGNTGGGNDQQGGGGRQQGQHRGPRRKTGTDERDSEQ